MGEKGKVGDYFWYFFKHPKLLIILDLIMLIILGTSYTRKGRVTSPGHK